MQGVWELATVPHIWHCRPLGVFLANGVDNDEAQGNGGETVKSEGWGNRAWSPICWLSDAAQYVFRTVVYAMLQQRGETLINTAGVR